jgi:hypothetical protein
MNSIDQILEHCNYIIKYSFNDTDNFATIDCSWDDNKKYIARYFRNKWFSSNYNSTLVECPKYLLPILVKILVHKICLENNFPRKYVRKLYNKKVTKDYVFDLNLSEDERSKLSKLDFLSKDLLEEGVKDTQIQLAKNENLWSDFKIIIEYYLNVTIEEKTNQSTETRDRKDSE